MIYTIFPAFAHEDEAISETTITIPASAEDRLPQQIRTIRLHDNFHFAGEVIPLANEDVRERLERELTVNSYFQDRKSTRLNSSHVAISYAVFCLKKKKKTWHRTVRGKGTADRARSPERI